MSNIATTISQSRKLIELGLDQKTADMVWMCNKWLYSIEDNILNKTDFNEQDTLAWSLSALLELMPEKITDGRYNYYLESDLKSEIYYIAIGAMIPNRKGYTMKDNIFEAAFEMVCWLLEQGLTKKGGQDENN